MKTILEFFYLRIMDGKVCYQRKEANPSKNGGDPNQVIWSLIQENAALHLVKSKRRSLLFIPPVGALCSQVKLY